MIIKKGWICLEVLESDLFGYATRRRCPGLKMCYNAKAKASANDSHPAFLFAALEVRKRSPTKQKV